MNDLFQDKNMRIKEFNHAKIYKVFKFFMHFYFTLFIKHKVHKNLTQNSKHTSHLIGKFTQIVTCSRPFSCTKNQVPNHTIMSQETQQKVSETQERIPYILKWVFACNFIPKCSPQTPKLLTRRVHKIFKDFYKFLATF